MGAVVLMEVVVGSKALLERISRTADPGSYEYFDDLRMMRR